MNCIIPFTKDIKFKTNIAEILSISLENDFTANPEEVLGNFTISGDYKSHEVSVNKDHFEYVLPFSVNMTTKIDEESVNFEVEDFTYEIIDNDILRVNIEYSINASEIKEEPKEEELFKRVEEPELDKILEEIETDREEPKEEVKEVKEDEERDITDEAKNTILDSINNTDDAYVTYHIHEMKETDTIESICIKYNTSKNIIGDYNDIENLVIGDKIIIPEVNE